MMPTHFQPWRITRSILRISLYAVALLSTLIFLMGCGSTQRHYYELLKSAWGRPNDVLLTREQVEQAPYDLIAVRVGKLGQATMALAFLEGGVSKWISSDLGLLVLSKGRIVKTVGFENDLLFLSQLEADPLRQIAQGEPHNLSSWERVSDWQAGYQSGYQISSHIWECGTVSKAQLGHTLILRQWCEELDFLDTKESVTNLFWQDVTTGKIVASQQQIAPHWPLVEIVHLSDWAKIVAGASQ